MKDIIGELNKYPEGYWDFKGKIKTGIHNIGKYPATMVPDMQYELLNIIVKQIKDNNIKLLDPFCGSGTTLVIAQDLGIDSTGIDINPYATLLSYVKTNVYDREKILSAIDKIENNLNQEQNFKEHYFYNIEKWFRKDIIQSLSKIRQCIIAEEDVSIRKFFWICLSETIFKFSNDRTSTFKLHILPEEKINLIQNECIEFFIGKVKENANLLNYKEKNRVKIIYGDCCEVMQHKLNEKFKIICTSPPYGDNSTTVTYGQASILFLKWIDNKDLSCEPSVLETYSTIDKISIGGEKRKVCNTKDIQLLNEYLNEISVDKRGKVINFFEDYYVVFKSMKSCLAKDGYLIMTVGNRSVDAIMQPLDNITIEIADKLGLQMVSKFNRNILYKKTPLTLSPAKNEKVVKSISEETILIFTK
ncbi:DNA methyltransferase [Campylobacter ureolyticus]|uniref:DNA methyltransferase n=1 Tax=Campylobacter ureolyticus TaxID=827 RepID=UPI001FC7FB4C|nr:DNA methyltransferase [Campylobacter ureolyticus]MCZ6104771.1 DNA methyltransferase [Campylobacter ureolyticus]MCZ6157386.1 DNA methyltransferase [Campylobacter ureolyticus]GKH60002.1 DNA modification methylase [Campylobacter ureolyticus]